MTDELFRRIVLPVASVEDAETTSARVLPRIRDGGGADVLAVHVIEKAGGAPDKAAVEQREQRARDVFAVVEETLAGEGISVDAEVRYGTDVVDAIRSAADEFDASAIVFTPRGGSRWVQLLTGDTARGLIERADRPVVVLPDAEEDDRSDADDADDEPTDGEATSNAERTGGEGSG